MNISIDARWEDFVDSIVKSGRYGSPSEVVREGLRLVEEREKKFIALRETIQASLAEGGSYSDEDIGAAIEAEALELQKQGY